MALYKPISVIRFLCGLVTISHAFVANVDERVLNRLISIDGKFQSMKTMIVGERDRWTENDLVEFASKHPNAMYTAITCKYADIASDIFQTFHACFGYSLRKLKDSGHDESALDFVGTVLGGFVTVKSRLADMAHELFEISVEYPDLRTGDQHFLKSLLSVNMFLYSAAFWEPFIVRRTSGDDGENVVDMDGTVEACGFLRETFRRIVNLVEHYRNKSCRVREPYAVGTRIAKWLKNGGAVTLEDFQKLFVYETNERLASIPHGNGCGADAYDPDVMMFANLSADDRRLVGSAKIEWEKGRMDGVDAVYRSVRDDHRFADVFRFQRFVFKIVAKIVYEKISSMRRKEFDKTEFDCLVDRFGEFVRVADGGRPTTMVSVKERLLSFRRKSRLNADEITSLQTDIRKWSSAIVDVSIASISDVGFRKDRCTVEKRTGSKSRATTRLHRRSTTADDDIDGGISVGALIDGFVVSDDCKSKAFGHVATLLSFGSFANDDHTIPSLIDYHSDCAESATERLPRSADDLRYNLLRYRSLLVAGDGDGDVPGKVLNVAGYALAVYQDLKSSDVPVSRQNVLLPLLVHCRFVLKHYRDTGNEDQSYDPATMEQLLFVTANALELQEFNAKSCPPTSVRSVYADGGPGSSRSTDERTMNIDGDADAEYNKPNFRAEYNDGSSKATIEPWEPNDGDRNAIFFKLNMYYGAYVIDLFFLDGGGLGAGLGTGIRVPVIREPVIRVPVIRLPWFGERKSGNEVMRHIQRSVIDLHDLVRYRWYTIGYLVADLLKTFESVLYKYRTTKRTQDVVDAVRTALNDIQTMPWPPSVKEFLKEPIMTIANDWDNDSPNRRCRLISSVFRGGDHDAAYKNSFKIIDDRLDNLGMSSADRDFRLRVDLKDFPGHLGNIKLLLEVNRADKLISEDPNLADFIMPK